MNRSKRRCVGRRTHDKGVLVIALAVYPFLLNGKGYDVSGTAQYTSFTRGGETNQIVTEKFRIRVQKNHGWKIKLVPVEPTDMYQDNDYHVVSGDGQRMYYLMNLTSWVKNERRAGRVVGENSAVGTVRSGEVPNLDAYYCAGPVWLAYASQSYFRGRGTEDGDFRTGRIEPASGLYTDAGRPISEFRVRKQGRWRLMKPKRGLPIRVEYYEPGERKLGLKVGNEVIVRQYKEPYNNGFTNSIYRVLTTTNVGGAKIPTRATFQTFWINKNGKSSEDLWLRCRFDIQATNVARLLHRLEFPPTVPAKTLVGEGRFLYANPSKEIFTYFVTNRFPTDKEVKELPGYHKASPAELPWRRSPVKSFVSRYLLPAVVFVILLVPFLAIRSRKGGATCES